MDLTKKLSSLQEISKIQLSKILEVNPNPKYLVIEEYLIKSLGRVCGVKWLKGNGVEKIFKLEPNTPSFNINSVFYFIFSNTKVFKQVVDQIKSQVDIENPPENKFHIVVVPQSVSHFEEELEKLGLLHTAIKLHSFQWMPIYLDVGLLSLELPDVYGSLFVHQNYYFLPTLSKVLWYLTFVVGTPQLILTLGKYSNALINQFESFCCDNGKTDRLNSDFGALIVIDRNIDYTSTLLTPGTYSALLSEVYKVTGGVCENKPENSNSEEVLDKKCNPIIKKPHLHFSLNSVQDSVYADIKNRYFTEVTTVLSTLTKQLKTEKLNSKEMALDEMKRYVQTQLQASKSRKQFITNHLLVAESIIDSLGYRFEKQKDVEKNIMNNSGKSKNTSYLDELLATENDKQVTLRLFCLLSVTQGLSESYIQSFWLRYLQQFGFSNGYAFKNLISAGFIPEPTNSTLPSLQSKLKIPKFSSNSFYTDKKNLKQLPVDPDKVDLKHPTCASYVFGGLYIPLIVQIASLLLNSVPLDEIKSKLEPLGKFSLRNENGYPLQNRTVFIYVIGGVTYAEVSACNLLETLLGAKIFILSEQIVTGNDLMDGVLSYPK